ncbi:molybdopterin-synthase adenylyltransferase MoeB [Zophobihabitans entericus]|uniref:Molybdopterin-synthase adenylyltransferase n=1 Tax=Zophobihabitans entericus TaxID=1635327 RepID=A0A6G9IAJ0_9GAMM|nr:molybdopterin-synthase adenylyltransferase MoeB [Zophobihabitans entericus]QIQ21233.1 molybdopterin-synthase adenylyltransferase MoeB [Zophobihabitans entericus]
MAELSYQELLRYNRQINLKNFDIDKQQILKDSSVLMIGLGGLGCAAAPYLVTAGIGHLTLVDFDTVSVTNLQRQILHTDETVGLLKVDSAESALRKLNPYVEFSKINTMLDDSDLKEQIIKHDIVLDCCDNLATRLQLNQLCYQTKTPLISGAAIRMEGLLSTFLYQQDEPCYHCLSLLFGEEQLTCAEAGVMSPLVGMIGSMQAMEVIKVLTHYGQPLFGRLLTIDAITMQFNELSLPKFPSCPVCSK